MTEKRWDSPIPSKCDICERPVGDEFVDGKTVMGPWGILCVPCHTIVGVGLGLGRGQRYLVNETGDYIKVKEE